jgi:hypothetical protein
MGDEYLANLRRELAAQGIANFIFVRRRRHRQLIIARKGRNVAITFAATGSDGRGPRNAVAALRRQLRGSAR